MTYGKKLISYDDRYKSYKCKRSFELSTSRYKQWFPIKKSTELAGIITDLIGDDQIQRYPKYIIDYTSNSIIDLKRFNSVILNLFRIKGKVRNCTKNKHNTMNLGINNKVLTRTLICLGIAYGSKINKYFKIPNWILNDDMYFTKFTNRLFYVKVVLKLNPNVLI